jgi:FtsP/CotA-like multicopper oxidase with cupredoxin domain
MAFSRLLKAAAALTLASAIQSVAASDSYSSSVCQSSSKCVPFVVDLTWGKSDPTKGISRDVILTNGTMPGPPLYLKVGDCVDFVAYNNLPFATGIHFHGISQAATPWADGVPGLSQYVIAPGTSYQYQWTATDSGTYFYHAHYKGQMMDGLYGAIIIAPADNAETPFSQISSSDVDLLTAASQAVEPLFVSDFNRRTFDEFFTLEETANVDLACSDSIVLNGFGSQYCPSIDFLSASAAPQEPLVLNGSSLTAKGCVPPNNAALQGGQFLALQNLAALPDDVYNTCIGYAGKNYTKVVDPAKGYAAFSIISPAAVAIVKFALDSHKLYVYEINGNYIVPQVVDQLSVSNGDRYSFFVKLDQTPGDYTMRFANEGINQVISGFGVMSYKGGNGVAAGVASLNYGGQNTTVVSTLVNALAAPFPASAPAASADVSFIMNIVKDPAQPTDAWAWTLSGVEAYNMSNDDTTPPLLFQNPSSIPASDLIITTKKSQWVDLIIKISGPVAEPHPIHKHTNKFYAIGAGVGDFNFTNTADAITAGYPINLQNPPYVDGFTSIPAEGNNTWMIFRYQAVNPGAWLLHCHVQSHFSGGMAMAILDGIDQFPSVPSDVGKVCPGTGVSNYPGLSSISSGSGSGGYSTGTSGSGTGTSTNNEGVSTTSPAISAYTGGASTKMVSTGSVALGLLALAFAL